MYNSVFVQKRLAIVSVSSVGKAVSPERLLLSRAANPLMNK
jgi:hypothetical protein